MKRFLLLVIIAGVQAQAQNIVLKDNRIIAGKELRRSGETVMTKAQMGAAIGDVGYPVNTIARIEFPEPPELQAATDLILQGKAADALVKIDPVVKAQSPFKDIQGNYWAQAAQIKLTALAATQSDGDAEALITDMLNTNADNEIVLYARVRRAAGLARKGNGKQAIEVCDQVIKESKRKATLADAWYTKGISLLQQNQFDPALLALLHISIYYPDQKLLMPGVLLACAKAYSGNEDFVNAKASLDELIKTYPASMEATPAKAELKKVENKSSSKQPAPNP